MKNILGSLSLLVVTVAFFAFRAAPANFSGSWKLNEGKSELGQFGGRGAASKIVVDQKTDAVTISRTATGFDGQEATNTETMSEGKEVESTVFGSAKRKATLKWAADQQSFTISFTILIERDGQSMEIKGAENWTIAADGKTITLANTVNTPQGEFSTKMVYDKQ